MNDDWEIDAPDSVIETWVYVGLITGKDKKKYTAWSRADNIDLDDASTQYWFAHKRGTLPVVGAEYDVRVTHKPEGGLVRHGTPVYVGRHKDDEIVAEMQARQIARDTKARLAALEANDKRTGPLDEALAPLMAVATKLPPGDRAAFAMYVLQKLRYA